MDKISCRTEYLEATVSVEEYMEKCVDVLTFLEYCKNCGNYEKIWSCPPISRRCLTIILIEK